MLPGVPKQAVAPVEVNEPIAFCPASMLLGLKAGKFRVGAEPEDAGAVAPALQVRSPCIK
jgi:hypothetical protein